jgi:hypothetical protein
MNPRPILSDSSENDPFATQTHEILIATVATVLLFQFNQYFEKLLILISKAYESNIIGCVVQVF